MLSIDYVRELNKLEHLFQNAEQEDYVAWSFDEPLALCGVTGSGKTDTIMKFCSSHSRRLYFAFRNLTADIAPKIFSSQYPDVFTEICNDWESFFSSLREHFAGRYHVLAFDDLDDRNDRDNFLQALSEYMEQDNNRNPFVILVLRNVESLDLSSYKFHMQAYRPADLRRSFPKMTDEDRIRLYSITGGNAGLLSMYDDDLSFDGNLKNFCRRDSCFSHYGAALLQEQFRSPESYIGILAAIAFGRHRLSDIAAFAGYSNKKCSIYLQALCDAKLVCTKKERSEDKRSTTRYYIDSGYMALWARFLLSQQIESLSDDEDLWATVNNYVDRVLVPEHFRRLCESWFHERRLQFEISGHSFVENYRDTDGSLFDHIYSSANKKSFIKIWIDLDGRYGAEDFQRLEDASVKINPYYDNTYFLFSIHRFKDDLWKLSRQYENIHLVEARFLSY